MPAIVNRLGLAALLASLTTALPAAAEPTPLDGDALRALVPGSQIELDTPLRTVVPIKFSADGLMTGEANALATFLGAARDRGRWRVSDDQLCLKWFRWFDSEERCMTLSRDGKRIFWRKVDGDTGTATLVSSGQDGKAAARFAVAGASAAPQLAAAAPAQAASPPAAKVEDDAAPTSGPTAPVAPAAEPGATAATMTATATTTDAVADTAATTLSTNSSASAAPAAPTANVAGLSIISRAEAAVPPLASDATSGSAATPDVQALAGGEETVAAQAPTAAATLSNAKPEAALASPSAKAGAKPLKASSGAASLAKAPSGASGKAAGVRIASAQPAAAKAAASRTRTRVSSLAPVVEPVYQVAHVDEDDVLNIRTGPSEEHEPIGEIPPDGRGVRIVGACEADWCPIVHGRAKGWVNSYYLAPDAAAPAKSATRATR